jgi:hypothetical protein
MHFEHCMADPLDCLVDGGAEVVEFLCKLVLAELLG